MNPVTLNQKNLAYYHFEQYHGSMSSPPTERQEQIAAFLPSESLKLGIAPTQHEIAGLIRFSSLNSVRSHLRLREKKEMLNRRPVQIQGKDLGIIRNQGNRR